jgi:hypothetical protein
MTRLVGSSDFGRLVEACATARGISVLRGICREEAAGVLADYARDGGRIYNGRVGASHA